MSFSPVFAGNVVTKPDPDLLRKFEAERDAAQADVQRAQELKKQGEEKIQRARERQKEVEKETDMELCRLGLLPASKCP